MKKIVKAFSLVGILTILGCASYSNPTGIYSLLTMNQREFTEISKISVANEKGFKYIKTTLQKNKFTSVSTTTDKQILNKEDEKKIKKILEKY